MQKILKFEHANLVKCQFRLEDSLSTLFTYGEILNLLAHKVQINNGTP